MKKTPQHSGCKLRYLESLETSRVFGFLHTLMLLSYADPCALRRRLDGKKKQKPATGSDQVIKDYHKYICYFKANKAGTENINSRFSKFASVSSILRLFL